MQIYSEIDDDICQLTHLHSLRFQTWIVEALDWWLPQSNPTGGRLHPRSWEWTQSVSAGNFRDFLFPSISLNHLSTQLQVVQECFLRKKKKNHQQQKTKQQKKVKMEENTGKIKCHTSSWWLREIHHRSISFSVYILINKHLSFCQKTLSRHMHMSDIQTPLQKW